MERQLKHLMWHLKNRYERATKKTIWLSCGFCGNGITKVRDWHINPEFKNVWIFCDEDCLLAHADLNIGLKPVKSDE